MSGMSKVGCQIDEDGDGFSWVQYTIQVKAMHHMKEDSHADDDDR